MKMTAINETEDWQELKRHYDSVGQSMNLSKLFESDKTRAKAMTISIRAPDNTFLVYDYSKNLVSQETLELLARLAKRAGVEKRRDGMFKGERLNLTENRSVL